MMEQTSPSQGGQEAETEHLWQEAETECLFFQVFSFPTPIIHLGLLIMDDTAGIQSFALLVNATHQGHVSLIAYMCQSHEVDGPH